MIILLIYFFESDSQSSDLKVVWALARVFFPHS